MVNGWEEVEGEEWTRFIILLLNVDVFLLTIRRLALVPRQWTHSYLFTYAMGGEARNRLG